MGAVLGGAAFMYIIRYHFVDPGYIAWLTEGDAGASFLAWHFFRHEPWHFPLGVITSYATHMSASVVFADSIPIMAILGKIFAPLLPRVFQYFGIWALLSFLLQGVFAWLLIKDITKSLSLRILATAFFVTSPILIHRWQLQHMSLLAHWMILAGFFLYFRKQDKQNDRLWIGLILLTATVHAYFLVMILIIWAAYLAKTTFIEKNRVYKNLAFNILSTFVFLTLVLWQIGYFSIPFGNTAHAGVAGQYSLNLLSPINPMGWSTILHGYHLAFDQQYEGFNYFGAGILLLIIFALYETLRNGLSSGKIRKHIPLLVASALLFVLAISPVVTAGPFVLFKYHLPVYSRFADMFRASGRFFWPIFYLSLLWALITIIKRNKTVTAIIILFTALVIQTRDISQRMDVVKGALGKKTWNNPLTDPAWEKTAANYQRFIFVPAENHTRGCLPIGFFAANKGMSMNTGSLPRINEQQLVESGEKLMRDLEKGRIDKKAIYIAKDEATLEKILPHFPAGSFSNPVNGYLVILPKQ